MLAPGASPVDPTAVPSYAAALASPPSPRKNHKNVEELFPAKLYHMLEEVDAMGLSAAVSWQHHGRAFVINDRQLFMKEVVPKFFKATKLRSFQRQLHLWGFHR